MELTNQEEVNPYDALAPTNSKDNNNTGFEDLNISARHVPAESDWTTPVTKVKEMVGMEVDKRTDREKDWEFVQYVVGEQGKGRNLDEIYSQSENPAKVKGLMAKYYKTIHPDDNEFDIAEMAGASPQMANRQNTNMWDDLGVGAASTMVNYGLGARAVMDSITPFDIVDESDATVKQMLKDKDDARTYYQYSTAEYDDDGTRNVDLQQMETIGELGPDMLAGGAVGAVAKSPGSALAGDLALTTLQTTLDTAAGDESFWEAYPKNLAINLTASAAGGILFPGGNPINNAYSETQLGELADGMKLLESLDMPLSQEMLENPASMKKKITEAFKNPWDRKQALAAVDNMNADVVNQIKEIANSVGATAEQLIEFKNGRISAREIGEKFTNFVTDEGMGLQGEVNVLRKSMEKMDLDPQGNPKKYSLGGQDADGKVNGWLGDLMSLAEDNDVVYNYMKRQIRHRGQLEGDDSIDARAVIDRHSTVLKDVKFTAKALKKGKRDLFIERVKLSRYNDKTAPDVRMKTKDKIKQLKGENTASAKVLKELYTEKGKAVQDYRRLKKDSGNLENTDWTAAEQVKQFTEFTAMDMESLQKAISHKIHVAGGSISTEDRTQMKLLEKLRDKLRYKMGKTIEDPDFVSTIKESNILTVKKYDITSDQGGIRGLKSALDSGDPASLTKLFTSDERGINNLAMLKDMNGGAYTDQYNEMLNKVYSGKVLKGVERQGDYNLGLDFDQLQKNLNADDFLADLGELATPEIVENFKAMRGLVNMYGKVFKEIGENQTQLLGTDKGWKAKLGELMEFIKTPVQGIKTAQKKMLAPAYDKTQMAMGSQKRMFWYDEKARFGDAINDVMERIDNIEKPADKKKLLDQTVTEFMKTMKDKAVQSGKTLRPGYIHYGTASSELPGRKAVPFSLDRIEPSDRQLMGTLNTGDTIRDVEGNLYKKTRKMDFVKTDDPGPDTMVMKIKNLDPNGKVAKKQRPGTIFKKDGVFYKRQKRDGWEQVEHTEGGKLQVDSTDSARAGEDMINNPPANPVDQQAVGDAKWQLDNAMDEWQSVVGSDKSPEYIGALEKKVDMYERQLAKAEGWTDMELKNRDKFYGYEDHLKKQADALIKERSNSRYITDRNEIARKYAEQLSDGDLRVGRYDLIESIDSPEIMEGMNFTPAEQQKYLQFRAAIDNLPWSKEKHDNLVARTVNAKNEYQGARASTVGYMQSVDERLAKTQDSYRASLKGAKGTAQQTSPLDDAVYKFRMEMDPEAGFKSPHSPDSEGWMKYFKNQGVTFDEMEGSRIFERMEIMEEAGWPITIDNVEIMLGDRYDKIYKTPLDEGGRGKWGPSRGNYVPKRSYRGYEHIENTYKNNVYTSKTGDSVDVIPGSRTKHFDQEDIPDIAEGGSGMFGHTRNIEYKAEGGGKGKVIGELQSDTYQNVQGTKGKLEIGDNHIFEVNNWIDEAQQGNVSFSETMNRYNVSNDEGTQAIEEWEDILMGYQIDPDSDLAMNVTQAMVSSPDALGDIGKLLREAPEVQGIPKVNLIVDDLMTNMQGRQVDAINAAIPKADNAKIPYGENWFRSIGGRELVDAYNEGFEEVKIPIGRFFDTGRTTEEGRQVWANGDRSQVSKVAEDMERGAGPTKWYTTQVKDFLESVGVQIDAKSLKYDPTSEMLTIKMPDKPFNITVAQGRGSVPSGHSGAKGQIDNAGEAYTDISHMSKFDQGMLFDDLDF